MQAKLMQLLNRLEALSARERAMLLVGLPLLLVVLAELLLFGPADKRAAVANKLADQQQAELKVLSAVLAAQPEIAALPATDQLLKQREQLQAQVDSAMRAVGSVGQTVQWGTVVRATVAGTAGLALTQLKAQPPELVFSPALAKAVTPAKPGASAPATVPELPGTEGLSIYRHRADLTVQGNFGTLLGYLQTLQKVPGDLRWERLQLSVAQYPTATVQLTLHTLSNRAETPFN